MKITGTMDLHQLIERIGNASLEEAAAMRALLVERHEGEDTRDIPEAEWQELLEQAVAEVEEAR